MERRSFYQIVRVFLACPGDLVSERSRFPRLLQSINNLRAHSLGLHLEPVGWERVMPSFGRPQELINAELWQADLVVVMFWNRVGFPSAAGSDKTGTIEEYELARHIYNESIKGDFGYEGHPRILLYFKNQTDVETPQAQRVASFRASLEDERGLFFREFTSHDEWEEMFREHVVAYIDGLKRVPVEEAVKNLPVRKSILKGDFLLRRFYDPPDTTLSFDLDGDGVLETIKFYFKRYTQALEIHKLNRGADCRLDEKLASYFDQASVIELALKDMNNDGFPELVIAAHGRDFTTKVTVWGFSSAERTIESFVLLGIFTGQYEVCIYEGGLIRMPFGSAGLFEEAKLEHSK